MGRRDRQRDCCRHRARAIEIRTRRKWPRASLPAAPRSGVGPLRDRPWATLPRLAHVGPINHAPEIEALVSTAEILEPAAEDDNGIVRRHLNPASPKNLQIPISSRSGLAAETSRPRLRMGLRPDRTTASCARSAALPLSAGLGFACLAAAFLAGGWSTVGIREGRLGPFSRRRPAWLRFSLFALTPPRAAGSGPKQAPQP